MLKNLVVRDVGPTGNRDGIKLSGVSSFRVEGCRIERWGSGGSAIDMVGCQQGVIRDCKFPEGARQCQRRADQRGQQRDRDPALPLSERRRAGRERRRQHGAAPTSGPPRPSSRRPTITVEDNEFIDGMAAIAFVGVDGALVQHNTIYRPRRWPLRILQENTDARFVPCRNGRFLNNLVAFRSDEVREIVNIGPKTSPESFAFSGNSWHCLDRPADTQRLIRLPAPETAGIYGKTPASRTPRRATLLSPTASPRTPASATTFLNIMIRIRSAALALLMLPVLAEASLALAEGNTRIRDVVYGRKFGMALKLDVWKPPQQNGIGVLFMVSGAFKSDIDMIDSEFFGPALFKPFLDRGHTLFLVCHGAQPKFTVGEIVPDIHRAVRFIRVHAKDHGVDPERLAIMGASSGGFLSLTIGTAGEPGDKAAEDPVERASSRVQAVAMLLPAVRSGRLRQSPAAASWSTSR